CRKWTHLVREILVSKTTSPELRQVSRCEPHDEFLAEICVRSYDPAPAHALPPEGSNYCTGFVVNERRGQRGRCDASPSGFAGWPLLSCERPYGTLWRREGKPTSQNTIWPP